MSQQSGTADHRSPRSDTRRSGSQPEVYCEHELPNLQIMADLPTSSAHSGMWVRGHRHVCWQIVGSLGWDTTGSVNVADFMLSQGEPGHFQIGEQFSRQVMFDRDAVTRFATMAGDFNPLHHDKQIAKASRFKCLIASSAHTSALMIGSLATFISSRAAAVGLGFSVKLRKAVRVGEKATIVWRVISIEPKRALSGDIITFEGEMLNSKDEVAVAATCANLIFGAARLSR
jgi:acyl dehydratase